MTLKRENVRLRSNETIEMRKRRRFTRPHIREQDSAALADRISTVPNARMERASFGFGRRLETFTAHVEEPSMKGTAQTSALETAEGQVSSSMRTCSSNQSIVAVLIAKQDQALTQKLDRF